MTSADAVVVGAGHNGLACACYLARAGLETVVLEAGPEPGGCIASVELASGAGRLELGAYEHAGIRASGVSADLELESRFGLVFHLREETTLGPCDDGVALAFYASLERTVDALAELLGSEEAARYREFARFAEAAMTLLRSTEAGPPPSLRELVALAEGMLGAGGPRLMQTLVGPASAVLRSALRDERLQGVLAHWAAHSQQSPADPGTGAGALLLAGGHGSPAARPHGGSRATIDALVSCLEAAGGRLVCSQAVRRVELRDGVTARVHADDESIEARKAVVSALDARRLFLELLDPADVPGRLREEVERIHVASRNVSELKVDAVIERLPDLPGPAGFERSFMLSPNTLGDIERAFASIGLGRLPERPPLMIAFPSTLEPGWAGNSRHVVWISSFVPWRLADGAWDDSALEGAADHAWHVAERALGGRLTVVERRITGPEQWVGRTRNPAANPNHIDMSIDQLLSFRPSPSLSGYRTPIPGLFLTGAGTHPGGGVTGIPGRNAAAVVLDSLGVQGRRSRQRSLRERLTAFRDLAQAAIALRKAA
jgi:beta-carotene ketolase (CrtO type)